MRIFCMSVMALSLVGGAYAQEEETAAAVEVAEVSSEVAADDEVAATSVDDVCEESTN